MTLKHELGSPEDFKSKWVNASVLMGQVCDKPVIVGILLCAEQAAAGNESYLIQHHLRLKKNLCVHNHPIRGSMNGRFEASPGYFVSLSQIHSNSSASEIQELSVTGILNFYIRKI